MDFSVLRRWRPRSRSRARRCSRWVGFWVRVGGGGRALPVVLLVLAEVGVEEARLRVVGVVVLDEGIWRVGLVEVGVEVSLGVADLGIPFDSLRDWGAHSSLSYRWIGRRRERIDCTGGPESLPECFSGSGGGGESGASCRACWCVIFVATVLQLK